MSKTLALLFAAGSEFLLLLAIVFLTTSVTPLEYQFEEPINVRLSTVPFTYKTELSFSEKTSAFSSYPLIGGNEGRNEPESPNVNLEPQPTIDISRNSGPKAFKLPEIQDQAVVSGNAPTNFLVEEAQANAAATVSASEFLEPEPIGPGIAKETLIPEMVRLESTQQGFRVEDFPNFYQVKASIEKDYTELLQRRPSDRHQLRGEVTALLTLEPNGRVTVKIERASAVELASIVVSNLSKLETSPRREERTLRIVVVFRN
ncbi:MAG: hypothetical protein PWP37_874 [Thermotogota bacterium]|nr:hypothetical protein [Thermotogota bacterium]MDK2864682.1 hypothetical protein [Thermotogota bacterium]HCZ06253.1 hypothetical protein [Thermotogota bacterium]